jgi:hypothetical protein
MFVIFRQYVPIKLQKQIRMPDILHLLNCVILNRLLRKAKVCDVSVSKDFFTILSV